MSGWRFSSFQKRIEYKVKPLSYSNVAFNQALFITLDPSLKSNINNYYDIAFVIDEKAVIF